MTLEGLRGEQATSEKAAKLPKPRMHPAWVANKLQRLDELLRRDPRRAKAEILKHLEGDLEIVPQPSLAGERRAEIRGRAKSDSLLRDQKLFAYRWLRGLDLNQRPLGSEWLRGRVGNPLILRLKAIVTSGSTLRDGAAWSCSFQSRSGCCGHEMGAASKDRTRRHQDFQSVRGGLTMSRHR